MSKGHHPFVGFSPPMPFGLRSTETWNAISWPAFMSGLHGVIAMSFTSSCVPSMLVSFVFFTLHVRKKPRE